MHAGGCRVAVPLLLAAATACRSPAPAPAAASLQYVGSEACAGCHAAAAELVAGTAHPLAMQAVSEASVLGRFDGSTLTHYGETSSFHRSEGGWRVRTTGRDGAAAGFEVTHALGVFPLQQYLVRFPDGRYQVLPFAWDVRGAAAGGQRWFHVHPDASIAPGDELHWTGPLQTWNAMCAECHVTGLQRNYDPAADAYDTAWQELGVGCEGCHGPGSGHVAWARAWERDSARAGRSPGAGLRVDLSTRGGAWVFDGSGPIAHRDPPLGWNAQVETCGACHSRREALVADYLPGRPLLDTHRPVLLDEGLYHPDGQIQDEVYEYGSFLQSRMYRAGVTCSDCHHPSTQEVPPGNLVCAKCHDARTFDTPAHHIHEPGSSGASCVGCHMPPRTYMVVDPRHDHAIRSPRPDLSLRIGTPNACTTCHADRSDAWAARVVRRHYGPPAAQRHYGEVLHDGRRGVPAADSALLRLAADTAEAGIVRATAVSLLGRYGPAPVERVLPGAARDPEPLVRLAAAASSEVLEPEARATAVAHLLGDSLLAIRVEAARVLAAVPISLLGPAAAARAADEYVAVQRVHADRPESHLRLGVFHGQRGAIEEAERAYRQAIRIGPRHAAGYANLADLYRALGREAESERVLREGIRTVHRPGVLHHGLGLLLVRTRRLDAALAELARAVELEPEVPRFSHVYAVALQSVGRTGDAIGVLERALVSAPHDQELRATLASLRGRD